jgi:hypothetical protein
MRKQFYIFITSIFFILFSNLAFGQGFNPYQHAYQGWDGGRIKKAGPIRAVLNYFSLNVSLGYGRTFYSHVVDTDVLESPEKLVMLGEYTLAGDNLDYVGVVDWLNAPVGVTGSTLVGPDYENKILYANGEEIKYRGSGISIPFNISLQLDIDRFRIGVGYIYEFHHVNDLKPKNQGQYPYVPNFNSTLMRKYYFTVGGKVYHLLGWDYNVNIEIGKVKYGNQYDKSMLQNGLYFNVGVPIEYEISEYLWLFVRPSVDFKNYTLAMEQIDGAGAAGIQHNQPALYLNFGVRMKLPEVKRCPVKSCRTQLKHVHGGREYRGQPFYKKQNPKIGELDSGIEQNIRKKKPKNSLKNYNK